MKYSDCFSTLDEWTPECWVNVETPTADELVELKSSAYWYIRYLKDAKNIVAEAEVYLKRSIRNEDLLKLIDSFIETAFIGLFNDSIH